MDSSAGEPTTQRDLETGRDYPRTYREFVEMFANEETCTNYLEQLRWPRGFSCPACGTITCIAHRAGRLGEGGG
jgi:hypothetical protein